MCIILVGILVTGITPNSGPSSSIVTLAGLFPPLTGDNTTVTSVLIGGISSKLLMFNESSIVVQAGFSQIPIPNAIITIVTEHLSYPIVGTTWSYTAPGNITMVNPIKGQNGTRVTIKGDNLVIDSLDMPKVFLAGNEAIVEQLNSTTILCRAVSGGPSNGSIIVNYTITIDGILYDGPTIIKDNAWQQVADGNITKIIPSAVAINQTVLLCGDSPLGGGRMSESVIINGFNTILLNSMAFSVENYTCINVMLPDYLTININIFITADTGAVIMSQINITIAVINSVSDSVGQYGSRVNISGSALFRNITSTRVTLAGINATVEDADNISHNWITVRAGRLPTILYSNTSTFTGRVAIIVHELGREFNLTNSLILWTYNTIGRVFSVMPSYGQIGTRVVLNGTNLYGYGISLLQLHINGTTAEVLNDTDSNIVFVTPGNDGSSVGPVDIQVISDNGDIVEVIGGFEYRPAGMIASITPSVGQRGTYGMCYTMK